MIFSSLNILFPQDLNNRPSCYKCHFKTIKRNTDITLYDCWNIDKFDKSMDDDKGTTMVLIHTEKGEKLFNETIPLIRYCKADVNKAIELDGIMAIQCPIPNVKRTQFFKDVNRMDKELINKYFPLSLKKSIVQLVKPILYKFNILKNLKRILG